MLCKEEIGKLLAKNKVRTARIQLRGRMTLTFWRIFAELDNPLSPKLADKQATEDDLNIDGGIKACFSLFLN